MAEKKKDLEYYLAQARRIEEHREAGAELEIRKLYKSMLKDLTELMSDTYVKYAKDDRLSYAILQEAGYHARFLEEVERRVIQATPEMQKELQDLVEKTYAATYEAMIQGVAAQGVDGFNEDFAKSLAITPEQIKAAVNNPVSGLTLTDTLEKNRKDIVYSIKQTVGIGLMNGDRYSTMAQRIVDQVDGDYKKAIRIARTEAHRVREAGNSDAAERVDAELQKGKSGMRMVKVWYTMKDERVRPQRPAYKRKAGVKARKAVTAGLRSYLKGANHLKMQDQTVLENELFDLGKGIKARAPGQSGDAGNDINCRCYASRRLMDDAEYFEATGKHFPGWEDKKKAAEALENVGNRGIMEAGGMQGMNLQLFANRSIPKQTDTGLKKSISSWKRNIEAHAEKLKNPAKFDADWDSKTDLQKAGLIRHWEKEIKNFTNDIAEAEAELARRRHNNGR